MNTDADWEAWGRRDPYYAVLTDPRFRTGKLDDSARQAFFDTGRTQARSVLKRLAGFSGADSIEPDRVLDFGCGVGRVTLAFAECAREVVGADVSASMLEEARRNCETFARRNVQLVVTDDSLANVQPGFDLVHSSIVLQHIEVPRGRVIFDRLVSVVSPGGYGALHVTFGWKQYAPRFGQPPAAPAAADPEGPLRAIWNRYRRSAARLRTSEPATDSRSASLPDPRMAMHYYNVSELLFVLHQHGVEELNVQLSDHDGALGAFLYFRKPLSSHGPVVA